MVDTRSEGRQPADDREHRRCDRRAGLAPERLTLGDSRQWLCSRATGAVLEVSIGTGLNLPHYPDHIGLTAVDLDAEMLSVARGRANRVRTMSLLQADAAKLPFAAASFDTVVCTLAMCEFSDRGAVLAEMHRVLRPGGRLLLLDHAQWRWPMRGRPVTLAANLGFVPYQHEHLRLGLIERLDALKPDPKPDIDARPRPRQRLSWRRGARLSHDAIAGTTATEQAVHARSSGHDPAAPIG